MTISDDLYDADLQHPIPVVWFGELVLFFGTPCIGSRTPAHDVQDNDACYKERMTPNTPSNEENEEEWDGLMRLPSVGGSFVRIRAVTSFTFNFI